MWWDVGLKGGETKKIMNKKENIKEDEIAWKDFTKSSDGLRNTLSMQVVEESTGCFRHQIHYTTIQN